MLIYVKFTKIILLYYQNWEEDASVRMVIIKATGDKAFCAGGDIRGMASNVKIRGRIKQQILVVHPN